MGRLQAQAESQNTEWKTSWRDEYLKWICGFANARGGTIRIGVNDTGEVVGVRDSKRLLEDIPSKIQMTLGIVCDVDLRTEDDKEYIEISVQPSSFPVSYRGEFHYRSGSTKRQLTGFVLADFIMRRTDSRWEDAPVENVTLDDVDQENIKIFKREALRKHRMTAEELDVSDEELLHKLGVYEGGRLTRAGVLLFTEHRFAAQTATYVKVGMFGERRYDLLYQDDFEGSLINTADKIVDTIYLKYLRAKVSYEGVHRVETYPFEREAVREGIYNALIHNVYMTGVPIQIRIDEQTMEISNSCILPEDWTVESLLASHKSIPYNPKIASVFYRAGYIENWGRGIERIMAACDELGAPRPEYEVVGYSITMRLHALQSAIIETPPVASGATETTAAQPLELNASCVTQKNSNVSNNVSINGTKETLDDKIMRYLKLMPTATYDDLALLLEVSRRTVQRHVVSLQATGHLNRIGSRKTGRWEVKL